MERVFLQVTVGLASLIPIIAGAAGAYFGADFFGIIADGSGASLVRYLTGLLLGIGIAYAAAIPRIELHGPRIRLLSMIVNGGGLVRLIAAIYAHAFPPDVILGLMMELGVAPVIWLWQRRIARAQLRFTADDQPLCRHRNGK